MLGTDLLWRGVSRSHGGGAKILLHKEQSYCIIDTVPPRFTGRFYSSIVGVGIALHCFGIISCKK